MLSELLPIALLLVGTDLGLFLEESDRVTGEEEQSIVRQLSKTLETRTGTVPEVESALWLECESTASCFERIRAQTGAADLVLIRIFGGPRSIHVIAERRAPSLKPREATVNLDRSSPGDWSQELTRMSEELFEGTPYPRLQPTLPPVGPTAPSSNLAPWITLGVGAALFTAGVLFGLSSAGAKRDLEGNVHNEASFDDLSGRQSAHGVAANVLFGAAAVGLAAGTVLLVID